MTASFESPLLLGSFESTLEDNAAFEALQDMYNLRIADYSTALYGCDPQSDIGLVYNQVLGDLVRARRLLNPGQPETLELGQLMLKHIGTPQ